MEPAERRTQPTTQLFVLDVSDSRWDFRAPTARIKPLLHEPPKRGPGPVYRVVNEAVLYRVVVDVIAVVPKLVLVADHLFPEAALPHTALAVADSLF